MCGSKREQVYMYLIKYHTIFALNIVTFKLLTMYVINSEQQADVPKSKNSLDEWQRPYSDGTVSALGWQCLHRLVCHNTWGRKMY